MGICCSFSKVKDTPNRKFPTVKKTSIEKIDSTDTFETQFSGSAHELMSAQTSLSTDPLPTGDIPIGTSRSMSGGLMPEMKSREGDNHLRSETVDANPHEQLKLIEQKLPEVAGSKKDAANSDIKMMALKSSVPEKLPDVTDQLSTDFDFTCFKKDSLRNAKMLITIEDITSSNSEGIIAKGQKVKIVRWLDGSNKLQVQLSDGSDETKEIDLNDNLDNLRPCDKDGLQNLHTFSLRDLMETVDLELRKLKCDDNTINVIKDFIQLRPRYFQEHQSVGGNLCMDGLPELQNLMLIPVSSASFSSLSADPSCSSYENKHIHLLEDGRILHEKDENFDELLPIFALTQWAFVQYRGMWKVVLLTDDKEAREMLDFHEVFQDPTQDVLLPADTQKFNSVRYQSLALADTPPLVLQS